MKSYILFFTLYLIHFGAISQITIADDNNWLPIGNTKLKMRFDDKDNSDGFNDGALQVDGLDTQGPLGVLYAFQGTIENGKTYKVQTSVYNYKSSYIRYEVQLYNRTDDIILTSSPVISISGNITTPQNTSIEYTATTNDEGDVLQLRYIRENTEASNHVARDFAIDYVSLNDIVLGFNIPIMIKPIIDIPSEIPSSTQLAEMDLILGRMSDYMLGTTEPSSSAIVNAVSSYDALSIVVTTTGTIDGNMPTPDWEITVWKSAAFLKTFAQYLKYNPSDDKIYDNGLTMQEMVANTVWFFCDKFYKNKIPRDFITYFYKLFAAPAIFLRPHLNAEIKVLFYNSLIEHSSGYLYFWEAEYITGRSFLGSQGAINMDDIGNMSGIQLVFGLMQDTPEERLQWTKGFKRYYERFMTYTPGTSDGIKSDGSAFHHRSGLNNYTYNFNTPMLVLSVLDGTSFQISKEAYTIFRKGIYTQLFVANEDFEPLSMSGRHPEARKISPNKDLIRLTSITGGHILGLSNPDPILANAYVRHWGSHKELPTATPEQLVGFKPLNYHGGGVYWKDNWMAAVRGESNWSFGAEMIIDHQHYGRYQSYGALEIIYPGGQEIGNGFKFKGWNWNFNPGTTSIVLPWNLLRSENKFQKEYQKKGFVGSLSLEHQNHGVYTSMAKTGVFAMDFSESDTNWGYNPFGSNTHDSSFKFKKSVFFFEDFILALGSGITNTDSTHPTVTTLFQRLSENQADVIVNGTVTNTFKNTVYNGSNWLIDNFNTGYYVVDRENNELHIQRKNQHIPYLDDFDYTLSEARPPVDYSIGYINHGTHPKDAGYEFAVKPDVSTEEMSSFATSMSDEITKPYTVYQKNENAHVVKDLKHKVVGYALFAPETMLPNDLVIKSNDVACLVMYKELNTETIALSISNPDMGFFINSFDPATVIPIQIVLNGVWKMETPHANVRLIDFSTSETTYQFDTYDGMPIEVSLSKSVPDPKELFVMEIYPNPSQNNIKIIVDSEVLNVAIYDMNSQLMSTDHKDDLVDISKLRIGPYLLKVQTKSRVFYKKFVKY